MEGFEDPETIAADNRVYGDMKVGTWVPDESHRETK